MSLRIKTGLVACVSLAALCPLQVFAQEAAPSDLPAAEEQSGGLEDIVVTAQRRAENLQNVPIAVSALTESRMEDIGVSNTLDLNVAVPALNTVSSLGFVKPFLRGIGSTGNGAGLEPPIAIYVDNVYIPSAPAALFSFNNVERIEVLKGPQGTLFGRNATGGLIHVITKDPGNDFEGSLKAGYGSYQSWDVGGYLAGPLTDGIKASLAVQYADQGKGYGTNLFNGEDANKLHYDFSARSKLIFDLGPDTTLKFSGDYYHRATTFFSFRPVQGYKPRFVTSIPSRVWDVNSDAPAISNAEGGGGSLRLDHDFGSVKLMSLSAYRKTKYLYGADSDASPVNALASESTMKDWTFTQELQLQSGDGSALKWVLGGYYFRSTAGLVPQNILFAGPLAPNPTSTARRIITARFPAESIAGFGEVSGEVMDSTFLTVGLRYTHEEKRVNSTVNGILNNGTAVQLLPPNQDSVSAGRLTWRISVDHRFSNDTMVYASYNRGFKSGGFSPSFPNDVAYFPERIDAYEVGFKSEFANNNVRLNAAAFYYDYGNIQVARFQSGAIGIYNGAKARIYGLDADLDAIVSDNFSLFGGVSIVNAKFTSFPQGVGAVPNTTLGGFTQVTNQDLSGNDLANAPHFTSSVGGNLHFPTSIGEVGGSVNWNFNSGYYTQEDNLLRQDSYNMINLTFRWVSSNEKQKATFWVRNLLNEEVITQKIAGSSNGLETFQPPRTYGITLETKF